MVDILTVHPCASPYGAADGSADSTTTAKQWNMKVVKGVR